MFSIQYIVLFITALLTALIAGLFYSYACSVTVGLGRLGDREYLLAMQSINKAILNPVFFISFMGTLLLLPVCTYLFYNGPVPARFTWLLIAAIIYVVGVAGVTFVGNIPLNNTLENFSIQSATVSEIAVQRANFEQPWNRLNLVRTIAALLSLVFVLMACLSTGSKLRDLSS